MILSLLVVAVVAVWIGGARAMGLLSNRTRSIRAPFPIPLSVPALLGIPAVFMSFIPPAVFLAWQPRLLRIGVTTTIAEFPSRTWDIFLVASLFSLLSFALGWDNGLKYQGADFPRKCAVISAGLWITSVALSSIAMWTSNVHLNILAHAVLFYWIASYAFPFMGELH